MPGAVEPLDIATLVIAVLGHLTGVASLVWQAASFSFEGARVQVTLMVAWLSSEGAVRALPGTWDWARPPSPAHTAEFLAIEVRNKGRGPATIGSWGIQVGEHFLTTVDVPLNPNTPYRLEGGSVQQWVVAVENIMDIARNLQKGRASINGEVRLGTGKVVKSTNCLKIMNAGTDQARLESASSRRRKFRFRGDDDSTALGRQEDCFRAVVEAWTPWAESLYPLRFEERSV